jgi:hypothetical protein
VRTRPPSLTICRDLLAAPPDPATLRRELDGLTAILESHFSFEERRIAAALDTLGPDNQFPDVFTYGERLR